MLVIREVCFNLVAGLDCFGIWDFTIFTLFTTCQLYSRRIINCGILLSAGLVLSHAGAVPLLNGEIQLQQKGGLRISADLFESIYLQTCTDSAFTTIGISKSLLDNFKLFANFTAASYCPRNEN